MTDLSHAVVVLLLYVILGGIPTLWALRKGVRLKVGQTHVAPPRSLTERIRRELIGSLLYTVGLVLWPVVLLKRRAVIDWLAARPWLVLREGGRESEDTGR